MSFSSSVKNELCRMEVNNYCCLFAELAAVIRISGTIKLLENDELSIKVVTESAAFARKVFSNIKKLYKIYPQVSIRKSKKLKKHTSYTIVMGNIIGASQILSSIGIEDSRVSFGISEGEANQSIKKILPFKERILNRGCCRKAYLRGAFLAGGSISDPEKTYHLEITSHSYDLSLELSEMVNSFDLHAKVIKRKGNFVTYIKEGEDIVDFLNIIGAHSALLELENIRILKEMRNNVNRIVNCETANLEKTVNASVRQVENIRYIRDNMGFESLPANLREIAEMRLDFSDANLKELGEMLSPPLGKSGVNHRLRKLDKIAEVVRNSKGEL